MSSTSTFRARGETSYLGLKVSLAVVFALGATWLPSMGGWLAPAVTSHPTGFESPGMGFAVPSTALAPYVGTPSFVGPDLDALVADTEVIPFYGRLVPMWLADKPRTMSTALMLPVSPWVPSEPLYPQCNHVLEEPLEDPAHNDVIGFVESDGVPLVYPPDSDSSGGVNVTANYTTLAVDLFTTLVGYLGTPGDLLIKKAYGEDEPVALEVVTTLDPYVPINGTGIEWLSSITYFVSTWMGLEVAFWVVLRVFPSKCRCLVDILGTKTWQRVVGLLALRSIVSPDVVFAIRVMTFNIAATGYWLGWLWVQAFLTSVPYLILGLFYVQYTTAAILSVAVDSALDVDLSLLSRVVCSICALAATYKWASMLGTAVRWLWNSVFYAAYLTATSDAVVSVFAVFGFGLVWPIVVEEGLERLPEMYARVMVTYMGPCHGFDKIPREIAVTARMLASKVPEARIMFMNALGNRSIGIGRMIFYIHTAYGKTTQYGITNAHVARMVEQYHKKGGTFWLVQSGVAATEESVRKAARRMGEDMLASLFSNVSRLYKPGSIFTYNGQPHSAGATSYRDTAMFPIHPHYAADLGIKPCSGSVSLKRNGEYGAVSFDSAHPFVHKSPLRTAALGPGLAALDTCIYSPTGDPAGTSGGGVFDFSTGKPKLAGILVSASRDDDMVSGLISLRALGRNHPEHTLPPAMGGKARIWVKTSPGSDDYDRHEADLWEERHVSEERNEQLAEQWAEIMARKDDHDERVRAFNEQTDEVGRAWLQEHLDHQEELANEEVQTSKWEKNKDEVSFAGGPSLVPRAKTHNDIRELAIRRGKVAQAFKLRPEATQEESEVERKIDNVRQRLFGGEYSEKFFEWRTQYQKVWALLRNKHLAALAKKESAETGKVVHAQGVWEPAVDSDDDLTGFNMALDGSHRAAGQVIDNIYIALSNHGVRDRHLAFAQRMERARQNAVNVFDDADSRYIAENARWSPVTPSPMKATGGEDAMAYYEDHMDQVEQARMKCLRRTDWCPECHDMAMCGLSVRSAMKNPRCAEWCRDCGVSTGTFVKSGVHLVSGSGDQFGTYCSEPRQHRCVPCARKAFPEPAGQTECVMMVDDNGEEYCNWCDSNRFCIMASPVQERHPQCATCTTGLCRTHSYYSKRPVSRESICVRAWRWFSETLPALPVRTPARSTPTGGGPPVLLDWEEVLYLDVPEWDPAEEPEEMERLEALRVLAYYNAQKARVEDIGLRIHRGRLEFTMHKEHPGTIALARHFRDMRYTVTTNKKGVLRVCHQVAPRLFERININTKKPVTDGNFSVEGAQVFRASQHRPTSGVGVREWEGLTQEDLLVANASLTLSKVALYETPIREGELYMLSSPVYQARETAAYEISEEPANRLAALFKIDDEERLVMPATGPKAEKQSLNATEAGKRPVNPEMNELWQRKVEDQMHVLLGNIDFDPMEDLWDKDTFEEVAARCIANMDTGKSLGVHQCLGTTSNLRDDPELASFVTSIAWARLQAWKDNVDFDALAAMDETCLEFAMNPDYRDPVRVFVKPEPHPSRKAGVGQWRIVNILGAVDGLLARMVREPLHKGLVAAARVNHRSPVAIGSGHSPTDEMLLYERLVETALHAVFCMGDDDVATYVDPVSKKKWTITSDISGWDRNLKAALLRALGRACRNAAERVGTDPKVAKLHEWLTEALLHTVYMTSSGQLACSRSLAGNLSGVAGTGDVNSIIRGSISQVAAQNAKDGKEYAARTSDIVAGVMGATVRGSKIVEHTNDDRQFLGQWCSHDLVAVRSEDAIELQHSNTYKSAYALANSGKHEDPQVWQGWLMFRYLRPEIRQEVFEIAALNGVRAKIAGSDCGLGTVDPLDHGI